MFFRLSSGSVVSCEAMAQQVACSRPTTRLSAATAQKGVQKGFLKHPRTSVSKSGSEMNVDARDYFAFVGFPVNSDPYDMCDLIKEHCHDHLGEFDLRVLGWAQFTEHDDTVRSVGLEFLVSQREALDSKIFELRDVWWSHKCQLSSVIVVNPQVFVMPTKSHTLPAVPAMPLLNQIPGVASTELKPEDHLQTRDPWRAYV